MNVPYQVNKMASGNLSLTISEDVSWENFPACATAFLRQVGGSVTHKADSPVERVWEVTVHGQRFWLAYDDWMGMSLDATSATCNEIVLKLQEELRVTPPGN
jgi:hypothetical protein